MTTVDDRTDPGTMTVVSPDRVGSVAVTVALAEFSALRNEIDNLAGAQRTMMNLQITVVAAIAGFVLAERADPHLLLALPFASVALGLVYQWYIMHAKHIGDYIDQELRPVLVEHAGDSRVLGWEHRLRTVVYRKRRSALAGRMAYLLLFPTVTAASLISTIPSLDSAWLLIAWVLAGALFAVQVTLWWLQVRRWVCWT